MTLCMGSVPGILCRAKHRSRVRQRIDKDVFTSLAAAIPAVQVRYPSFSKWPPKFPQYSTRAKQALPKQIRRKCPALGLYPLTFKAGRLYPETFIYNTRHVRRARKDL